MAEVILYYSDRNGVDDPAYIEGGIVGKLVRCKDCQHFAIEEHWADIGHGAKVLCADKCPTCHKWGGHGGCKTDPEGFCFLAERKET